MEGWKYDGGVTNQQAIHHIDIARWIFGPVSELVYDVKSNEQITSRGYQ